MRDATEALIVIDVQNDFCPGGALAVQGGDEIVPGINALLPEFGVVVFTQDWHPGDHQSFASQHPGSGSGTIVNHLGHVQGQFRPHRHQPQGGNRRGFIRIKLPFGQRNKGFAALTGIVCHLKQGFIIPETTEQCKVHLFPGTHRFAIDGQNFHARCQAAFGRRRGKGNVVQHRLHRRYSNQKHQPEGENGKGEVGHGAGA